MYIHLDLLEDKEVLEFRLDKFYKWVKEECQCVFVGGGVVVDGVLIRREGKKVYIEG